jgi:hypothetical protein
MKRVLGRIENRIKIDEDIFVYMRELDEAILAFKEIINYKVYIEDGNIMVIDLVTLSEKDFYKSSEEILSCIKNIPSVKQALNMNVMEIMLIYSVESMGIKNTMIKRKICDYRKKV